MSLQTQRLLSIRKLLSNLQPGVIMASMQRTHSLKEDPNLLIPEEVSVNIGKYNLIEDTGLTEYGFLTEKITAEVDLI